MTSQYSADIIDEKGLLDLPAFARVDKDVAVMWKKLEACVKDQRNDGRAVDQLYKRMGEVESRVDKMERKVNTI